MRHTKIVLLGSLYLAQGLPYGFFTQALPVLLRKSGMSLPLIGLANLLALPWALKFLWAPFIDRVKAPRVGRRRAVIIPMQLASTALLAALAFTASPSMIWALCVAVLLVNLFAATQDIATDGLAVEILGPDERGLGNGLQVGAYRAGMIVGGGALLIVFGWAGWTVAFLGLAALMALTTVPVLRYRELSTEVVEVSPDPFRLPPWSWVVVLLTYKLGEWFATGMLRAFLTDAKLGIGDIGLMVGVVGFSAATVGALVGGVLTTRLGRSRALVVFGALQTLAIGSFALAAIAPSEGMFYAVTVAEHLTSAMATAALFTAMMDRCRPGHEGTDYTVQASIVVVGSGVVSAFSGVSASALGYPGHFAMSAVISAIACVVAGRYARLPTATPAGRSATSPIM